MSETARKAVFIDRDGTINEMVYDETHGLLDSPRRPEQVVVTAGAADFIKGVKALGYLAVVVTNQPGLAKGTLTAGELDAVHARLAELLAAEGAAWDDLRYCPHHPDGGATPCAEYVKSCVCRKPQPGMLVEAAKTYDIDLLRSWMVGDGLNDMQAGQAVGCRSILLTKLKVGQLEKALEMGGREPDGIVGGLAEALELIRKG